MLKYSARFVRFAGGSRRAFLAGLAAVTALAGFERRGEAATGGYSAAQIAARDAANMARRRALLSQRAPAYTPITADIVHFLSYGQSLDLGETGTPVLSTMQPFDNLMLGQSNRAAENSSRTGEVTTTWVPLGVDAFLPLVANTNGTTPPPNNGQGESPAIAALNNFRGQWLQANGQSGMNPAPHQFVLTTCGIAKTTVADLLNGANPDVFNRVVDAVNAVRNAAQANGQTYQFAGVFYTHGEQDVHDNTPYAVVKANLQTLQGQVAQAVAGITGTPCRVPWVMHQPATGKPYTNDVHQAWLDLSTTAGSDFYCGGPVDQYPANKIHRTANGYRWFGAQYAKALSRVLIDHQIWLPCHVMSVTYQQSEVLVNVFVPQGALMVGTAYTYAKGKAGPQAPIVYDNLGLSISDDAGVVPITSAAIVGAATIKIVVGRTLSTNPILYSGICPASPTDLGTNICDMDTSTSMDKYIYGLPGQSLTENIAAWNGAQLVGQPYPLNNYLAIGRVAITAG